MVSANNVIHHYENTIALNNVSLEVQKGELFGLIGPDGAGKTTLLRLLMTLLKVQSGNLSINGWDVMNDYREIRKNVGYMPGRFSLYPDLSVEENLNFFASVFGTTVRENYQQIKAIYSQIEPFKNRRAGKLSGGMKQKLALCCALVHKPLVLILDEPTTGVDAVSRSEFWDMLTHLKEQGITILVSTPYMDEAELCDKIALMHGGKLLNTNTTQNLVKEYHGNLYALRSKNKHEDLEKMRKLPWVESVHIFGQDLNLTTEINTPQEVQQLLEISGFAMQNITKILPNIENVFIQLATQHE